MQKIVFRLAVIVVFAFTAGMPASAQESNANVPEGQGAPQNRMEMRDTVQERVETLRNNIQQNRDDFRDTMEERRQEMQSNMQGNQQELRGQVQERRQELRVGLDLRRKRIIDDYFARMVRRLNAAIMRQETLIDRIESRIEKFRERGAESVETERLIMQAKGALENAKEAIEAAETKFSELKESQDPKTLFESVRDLVHNAAEAIRDVHALLAKAIAALKGASSAVTPSGTSTSTDEDNALVPGT